ncbi:hypothetical protein IKG29_01115 [Candidatus Saccharibacteria bacterium]|nr:hypothetical protein [Candidatus Saccharibacteria bacterium]
MRARVVLKQIVFATTTLLLMLLVKLDGSVFATIDPNNYSINWNIQNKDQGIEIADGLTNERYVSTMRTIFLSTNAPSGYRVYINVSANEASAGNLVLIGGTSSSPSISTLNTTPANASTLATNTWGFGIPNTTSGLPSNTFSSTYTSGTPSASSTYSGVKVNPGITLIRNKQGAVSGTDSFDVYYGMRIGSDIQTHPGTYQTTVSYHALIEATDVVGGEATITPTSGPKTGDEFVTITTSLKTDFVPGDLSVTLDGQACLNPTGNISTGVLRITCTTQAHMPEATDVVVSINSLGLTYTIPNGYEYLETGDVKITNISYVEGVNVNGTPHPSINNDGSIDFDLSFKSGQSQDDESFSATYSMTITNTTSSPYIFTAPQSNLVLRLSATTTAEVYYELVGVNVGDTIPPNSSLTYRIILTADYVSGTHGVEGGMEIEPVEDKSGALVGSIYGSNEGDLTGNNDLAMFQINVQNTFTSAKNFTIDIMSNDFQVADAQGGYLNAQTIAAESTATYTFYVKKTPGAVYGSDFVNAPVIISYDGIETSSGFLKLAVDKDPSYVDAEAPMISDVTVTRNNTVGSATVTWVGSDNVGVASYAVYPCIKNNDTYSCATPITGISGNTNSYTLTGLSEGMYGVVVVGFDDEGNTATQTEIDSATTAAGHASRSSDTELRWTFNVTGNITNGSLSNNGSTVQIGGTYTGTLNANNNYSRPNSITVVMNGRTLTSGTDYTYSSNNGSIRIDNVDGDITITASCPSNGCLIEGTLIALADGTTKPIEDISYRDLLKVWNHETGAVGAEYPARIEKASVTNNYQLITFSDGTTLGTVSWHGIFDVNANEFVSVDDPSRFYVGLTVYKVDNNGQLVPVTVTSIEQKHEEKRMYYITSSKYYNIISNDILTTNGNVITSNFYGFEPTNIKWPAARDEFISNPDNLYTYDDFADIGIPLRMFNDLRLSEAAYLKRYGITLEDFKQYLVDNRVVEDMVPYDDE